MKRKYCEYILEIIRRAKENTDWSISDYAVPLKDFYKNLSSKDKKEFNSSIIELLHGKMFINNLVHICRELRIEESCEVLLSLFVNKPSNLKEGRHPVWIEGLERDIIYTLGVLKCKEAVIILKQLIEKRVRNERALSFSLGWDTYGVIISALTNIAPEDSAKYFGWWIKKDQKRVHANEIYVKQLDDWKIMQKMNITPNMDSAIFSFSSVKDCIISVAQNKGLLGLKKWLSSVTLYSEKDKEFLREQIQILADGTHTLIPNLKKICNYKGGSSILAKELSALPRIIKDTDSFPANR